MLSNLKKYYKPQSIAAALALLEKNSGTILVIAGGTKLVPSQNDTVQELVDITELELNYIKNETGSIRIGATTTLQEMIESPVLNNLYNSITTKAALCTHHSIMIRNVSTIGGELVSTNPLSVYYCALLVLQAQVRIVGGEEFALAMNIFLNKKDLAGGLLIEIIIPRLKVNSFTGMASITTNKQSIPLICACVRLSFKKGLCQNVKLAMTGFPNVPQRLPQVEALLEGQPLTNANIEIVSAQIYKMYNPISDNLASAEYRQEVSGLVMKNALRQCLENAEAEM